MSGRSSMIPDKLGNKWALTGLAGGLILLAGLVPRILYLRELPANPGYLGPGIDGAYHLYWARGLATGVWEPPEGRDDPEVWRHPFYRPPGYPYLLAGVFRFFGLHPLAPRIFQSLLGLAAILGIWRLGQAWFSAGAGLAAGLLASASWVFVYFEGELLDVSATVLLAVLLLNALTRASRPSRGAGLAAGLLLGTFALFRGNVLLFAPPAAVWLLWAIRPRRALAVVALFGAGTLLPLVPGAVRNWRLSGEFVPLATNFGISLGVANNASSDGTTHHIPGIGEIGTPFDWPRIVRNLEMERGMSPGSLSHRAASGLLADQAFAWIKTNPGRFLALLGRKALFFWGPREVRNVREIELERFHSPVLSALPLNWPLALALGLAGFALAFAGSGRGDPRRRCAVLGGIFILFYFLSVWPFAVAARYRVPVLPVLLVLGGNAAAGVIDLFRSRRWRALAGWGGGIVLLWGLCSLNLTGYDVSPEKWHNDRGLSYFACGLYREAAGEFEEAVLIAPGYADSLVNLGVSRQKLGDVPGAIESYRRALRFKDSARVRRNLAEALIVTGRHAEALTELERALSLDPAYTRIRREYARLLAAAGHDREAAEQFRLILEREPGDPESLAFLRAPGEGAR